MPRQDRHARREPRYARRRYWGMLCLVSVLAIAAGVLVSLSAGIHPQHNEAFRVVPRAPYRPAYNPIALAELGLPPNSSEASALPQSPAVRAIVVMRGQINVMAAGKKIRQIRTHSRALSLRQVMKAVRDKALIEENSAGKVTLKAALIVHRGASLTIGAPFVSELHLVDAPSVFVGTEGGKLTFDSVTVRAVPSGDPATPSYYQPFVIATTGAVMNVANSTFSGLGWDWNASYGVSWVEGSTGYAVGSTFKNSFIGVYTSESHGLSFRDDTFRDNALYGLDPHTYSSHLTIENVTAEGNKAHGIIFSDHVTESTIRNSVSQNNGENGIMMDEQSTRNKIVNNVVTGNTGDGLVTSTSPDNTFTGNQVEDNRVGIRVGAGDAERTAISHNRVTSNGLASEGVTVNASNAVTGNGGQWNWFVVKWTWSAIGGILLAFALHLALAERRHRKRQRPLLTSV